MSDVRIERVAPCSHGLVNNHDYGPPHDPIECIGGFRTVLSGFPPEAVEALAFALGGPNAESYRGVARLGLAAAWQALTGEADKTEANQSFDAESVSGGTKTKFGEADDAE